MVSKTVLGARAVFTAFFNYCVSKNYLDKNPFDKFNKRIKSEKKTEEKHVPFADEDLKAIMSHLDATDRFACLQYNTILLRCYNLKMKFLFL
jgi:hypothetical protein